jgi:hypothetical protein
MKISGEKISSKGKDDRNIITLTFSQTSENVADYEESNFEESEKTTYSFTFIIINDRIENLNFTKRIDYTENGAIDSEVSHLKLTMTYGIAAIPFPADYENYREQQS